MHAKRTTPPKRKPRKIEAHRTMWSVVRFQGAGLGVAGLSVDGRTLLGLYATKVDADAAAAKVKGAFVLPPRAAWGGKD
jgi:hypothetical protein